jgi:methionyl-tRNA formyltransferase
MRGSNPWFWTLVRDERETAATVHHMVARLDAGDIIFQSRFRVEDDDTLSTLLRKSILESLRLVRPLVDGLRNGALPRTPQNEQEATTFREPADADYRIDWRMTARNIQRLIRASCSAPGALTRFRDSQLRITRAEIATDPTLDAIQAAPGDVIKITPAAIVVRTGEGQLVLRTLRHEDRDVAASAIVGPNQSSGLRFE